MNVDKTINKKINLEIKGETLFFDLQKIKSGQGPFTLYEEKCIEILKYLFPEYLTGWDKQLRTDDGLNRYDLVCRIKKGDYSQ